MCDIGKNQKVINNEPEPLVAMEVRTAGLLGAEKIIHGVTEKVTVKPVKTREKVPVRVRRGGKEDADRVQRMEDKNH